MLLQKYGMLEGTVKTVSADSGSAQNQSGDPAGRNQSQDLSFKALIDLHDQQLNANGLVLSLAAGMQVSAEIVQGQRTVAEYLLSPIQRVGAEMAQER